MVSGNQLLNRWIEYTGGSRPKSNFLRFSEIGERGLLLEIKYVFDWETREVVNLRFHLSRKDYNKLVHDLLKKGHAELERASEDENLSFEWKISSDNRVYFRMSGEGIVDLDGKSGYRMSNFQELIVGSNFLELDS